MISAPLPDDEAQRLATLKGLEILDIEPQERFDGVTSLAKRLLDAGYVAISLIDQSRQWFLSSCGLDVSSTSRDISFCAHTILEDATLVVEDARKDERFSDNPLVTEGPMLRAYMGHPIVASGNALGALCVLYKNPQHFSEQNKDDLRHLARVLGESIEYGLHRNAD